MAQLHAHIYNPHVRWHETQSRSSNPCSTHNIHAWIWIYPNWLILGSCVWLRIEIMRLPFPQGSRLNISLLNQVWFLFHSQNVSSCLSLRLSSHTIHFLCHYNNTTYSSSLKLFLWVKPKIMQDFWHLFFASTIPGHGSSSTLGSNGARPGDERPSNISREVGDGQHDESPTPREVRSDWRSGTNPTSEVRHEQCGSSRIESPPGDEENPNRNNSPGDDEQNPEDECIKYMDDVVETFRRKETMKLKARSQIISILDFNPSRTEEAKDAAVKYYARTLNEIEALCNGIRLLLSLAWH